MPYLHTFSGAVTTLASSVSDSGHTHSVVSTDGGTLRVDGSGALEAVGNATSGVYVSNYVPASADEPLVVTFDLRDLGNMLIGAGARVQPDGDGIFVRTNGFDNAIELIQYISARGGESELDSLVYNPDDGPVVSRIEFDGLDIEWFLDGVSQGTFTLDAALAGAGSVGYEKYSETLGGGGEVLQSVEMEAVGGGGGDEPEPNCFLMTAGGLVPCVSRVMTSGGLFPPVS